MTPQEARRRLRLRADGRPAKGQPPILRVLGRCEEVGDCWEFQGHRTPDGYGMARYEGRMQNAHRIVFQELRGPLPGHVYVCHRCDNPPCCNPDHLFTGSVADNNRDRHAKGRTRGLLPNGGRPLATHCLRDHPYDEANTYVNARDGRRGCRACKRLWASTSKAMAS